VQSTEYTVQPLGAAKGGKPAFYNLLLWEKAQTLASQLVLLVDGLPQTRSANALGNQLLRAGTSIAANIAEGYGRYSDPAFRNHLSIARGSLFETESWIDLLARASYLPHDRAAGLIDACEEIARLITSAMKPLKRARATIREERGEYVTSAT